MGFQWNRLWRLSTVCCEPCLAGRQVLADYHHKFAFLFDRLGLEFGGEFCRGAAEHLFVHFGELARDTHTTCRYVLREFIEELHDAMG